MYTLQSIKIQQYSSAFTYATNIVIKTKVNFPFHRPYSFLLDFFSLEVSLGIAHSSRDE